MKEEPQPLKALLDEIPPAALSDSVDAVMIDYAIACVKEMQTDPPDEAISNIRNIKRLRDALKRTSGNPKRSTQR